MVYPDAVAITGVGMHRFGRHSDLSLKDLGALAVRRALKDAGLQPADIQAAYASNALGGVLTPQAQIRGQVVMSHAGIEGIPIVNVENACASGSTAFRQAVMAVHAGVHDAVLVVGFEKMFVGDRNQTIEALRSAADVDVISGLGLQFTGVYGMRLQERISGGSLTVEDLAAAAVKARFHGSLNPYAQYQSEVTLQEVLDSKPIAEPLTRLMCSSFSDGAAAVVVVREGSKLAERRHRVRCRGSEMTTARTDRSSTNYASVAAECAELAYNSTGIGPEDLDVLEVHDAMAPGELLYYEDLGLCPSGEGARLLRSGETTLGGARVVNPSGGLSSRGHPVGATGLAQIIELVLQLRGQAGQRQVPDARRALAQNSGGWINGESAVCNITILEAV